MKTIKFIPQKRNEYSGQLISGKKKKKVCAYARVSTDLNDQKNSFSAQQDYYKKLIKKKKEWDFCGLFSDEGISGLSTSNRNGFNEMIKAAYESKIDLIITKSVSRFARNTIDSLQVIRDLKNKGVEIYFEKEKIWTFSQNGEILLTLMSSFAQEESRSISLNVLWSKKRMMENGKYSLPYSSFLGYDKGDTGLVINKKQAEIVRMIFDLYISGLNSVKIKEKLESMAIPSPRGNKTWNPNTILSILRNEKYKGDVMLQKYYTKDYISKKIVKNNGIKKKYYIENSHEALIDRKKFDYVQELLLKSRHVHKK